MVLILRAEQQKLRPASEKKMTYHVEPTGYTQDTLPSVERSQDIVRKWPAWNAVQNAVENRPARGNLSQNSARYRAQASNVRKKGYVHHNHSTDDNTGELKNRSVRRTIRGFAQMIYKSFRENFLEDTLTFYITLICLAVTGINIGWVLVKHLV